MTRSNTCNSVLYSKFTIGRRLFVVFNYSAIIIIIIIAILPLANLLSISLSSNEYVAAGEVFLWPKSFTIKAYSFILKNEAFYNSVLVSVKMSVIGVGLLLLNTILAAYPLSKDEKAFRARKVFLWVFVVTMLFSGGLVPWFMIVKYTGLINSIWGIALPGSVNVFYILLMMNFIRGLPKELEESAFIDGAGHFRTLASIILPLTKPAIATIFLFSFVSLWNSWFEGIIVMTRVENYPLQTYLYTILQFPDLHSLTAEQAKVFLELNQRSVNAAQIFVSALPIFIIYPFISKYFTKGIVLGSVKG